MSIFVLFIHIVTFHCLFHRWDHLSELLKKILNERPKGIADTLEEYSLKIRESRFRDKSDHLRDLFVPPEHYDLSQKLLKLLQVGIILCIRQ